MTVSCAGAKVFDYQSDRHRSKTRACALFRFPDLITSQIDTAPKLNMKPAETVNDLITSQIDTAPKRDGLGEGVDEDLITSQIDTAPKQVYEPHDPGLYLITSQIDTAPKPRVQRDAELRI